MSAVELKIQAKTFNSLGDGNFASLANYLASGMPNIGGQVRKISVQPHFAPGEVVFSLQSRAREFLAKQEALPQVVYSRKNGNITVQYNSCVCDFSQLRAQLSGSNRNGVVDSVVALHGFCLEIADQVLTIKKQLTAADDLDVDELCAHFKKRESELSTVPAELLKQLSVFNFQQQAVAVERSRPEELPDDVFWKIMESVDVNKLMSGSQAEALDELRSLLSKLKPDAICSFQRSLNSKLELLNTRAHFQWAKRANSDDSFLDLRLYVVGMGKEFYQGVLEEPRFMPGGLEQFELLHYVASEAWAAATSDVVENFYENQ